MSKILHVVNISFVLPYYIGDQFDYFRKKDYDLFVACTPSEHLFSYGLEKGFKTFGVNILRAINPVADIKAICILVRIIKNNNIDIVIGHTPKGAMIAMIAASIAGVKQRIYFRHGLMYETSTGLKKKLLIGIEKLTGRLAKRVVCVSNSVINKSIKLNLNKPDKNILLNKGTCNGINLNRMLPLLGKDQKLLEQLGIAVNDRVIGYVGRLVNDKGINELLEAWRLITSQYNNVKLLLVGPFEERDSISEATKEIMNTTGTIIHTGLINDVVPYYNVMDVFILPSYREGFPTVVLEASAMRLPVITTRSTGCVDSIVEEHTGIFTEISSSAIAEALKYYLANPDIARQHGINGRKFVEDNFNQEIIWKEIESKVLKLT